VKKLVAALVVAGLSLGVGYRWLDHRLHEPYRGYLGDEQFVEIAAGAGASAISRQLVEAGVMRDLLTARAALWMSDSATRLKAGEYRFAEPMSPRDVFDKITRGDVHVVSVTFPEGLTIIEMATVFEARGMGSAADFVAAASDPALVRAFDPIAPDLEGYLFPDTYAVPRRASANTVVRMMVDRFVDVLSPEWRAEAGEHGWSIRQWTTLASIVEKETATPAERPMVAAVYRNRLRIGMGLQCDPTVIYALQKAGRYDGNLRRNDLQFDSPYNTYRYAGLPPGPIAAPGRDALAAVLAPADVTFLYFVSRNDGTHAFARSLGEHNRNVQTYQLRPRPSSRK
jgi:UPF0755 protein